MALLAVVAALRGLTILRVNLPFLGFRVLPDCFGYCLHPTDGSLLDVALLAAVAALRSLAIPAVAVNEEGDVVPSAEAETAAEPAAAAAADTAAAATAEHRCRHHV